MGKGAFIVARMYVKVSEDCPVELLTPEALVRHVASAANAWHYTHGRDWLTVGETVVESFGLDGADSTWIGGSENVEDGRE